MLRWQIGLICSKYYETFPVREVESNAYPRASRDEIDFDTHIIFGTKRTRQLALRRKDTYGRQLDIVVTRSGLQTPNSFSIGRPLLRHVGGNDRASSALLLDSASIQEDGSIAQRLNRLEIVTDKQHRAILSRCHIAHLAKAPFLELEIPDSQDLIHQERVGLEMGPDGECQTHMHA
jgi:hypothetical protein